MSTDNKSNKVYRVIIFILSCLVIVLIANNFEQKKELKPVVEEIQITEAIILKVLRDVAVRFERHDDLNGDGKSNCIDAAIMFYEMFPDRKKVRIVSNYSINHTFNYVLINGKWISIEPQAHYARDPSYLMENVWKEDYDRRKDIDETHLWSKFAK